MLRLMFAPAVLAIVAGCASPPTSQVAPATATANGAQVAAANPNERKQICVREQPIGSAIPATRCHYEEDGVEREMNIGGFASQVHRSTPATSTGSGG